MSLTSAGLRHYNGKPYLPTHEMFTETVASATAQTHANLGSEGKIIFDELCQRYMDNPTVKRVDSTRKNYIIIQRALSELLGADKYVHEIGRKEFTKLRNLYPIH